MKSRPISPKFRHEATPFPRPPHWPAALWKSHARCCRTRSQRRLWHRSRTQQVQPRSGRPTRAQAKIGPSEAQPRGFRSKRSCRYIPRGQDRTAYSHPQKRDAARSASVAWGKAYRPACFDAAKSATFDLYSPPCGRPACGRRRRRSREASLESSSDPAGSPPHQLRCTP